MTPVLFFRRLIDACTFEELALRLTSKERINQAKELFPYANPRIMMSSVMVYKFPLYHNITETSEVYSQAKKVCLTDNLKEDEYKKFENLFYGWIKQDKDVMMIELNKAQEELSKTIEEEGVEWADRETWKEGIDAQIKLIEDSKLVLEKSHEHLFGSPPK